MVLFDRCTTAPEITALHRDCYELPMACFLLAIKFSDGFPPRLVDLCRAVEGIEVSSRNVEVLETAVLSALQWNIDTVTVAHLLLQAVQLLPTGLRGAWTASIRPHLDVYHTHSVSTEHRASTAAAAILGLVALAAGFTEARLARWLPEALTPPLDALARGTAGVGALSARQKETLACIEEQQRALSRASTPKKGSSL